MKTMDMFLENEKLVYWVVNKRMLAHKLQEVERDDLEQEGRIGLLKAIEEYQSREELRKYAFTTIATRHIQGRIGRYLEQKVTRHKDITSLNLPLSEEEGGEIVELIEDKGANTHKEVEQRIESQRIRAALAKLTTPDELDVLYARKAFDISYRELEKVKRIPIEELKRMLADSLTRIRKSNWYLVESRRRLGERTPFIKARQYTYRPERMTRAGAINSPVESLVIQRESMGSNILNDIIINE